MSNKKVLIIVLVIISAAIVLFMSWFDLASLIASRQKKNDNLIREQMAYHVGVLAYLYGYPFGDMYKQMHNETHRVSVEQQVYAPVNRMYRYPDLVTPGTAGNLRAPNNDTLYYAGWFDISKEPLIIHTPDTSGRYYTIAVTNLYAEATHIGRRTTGTAENYFALVPSHWSGELPEGVRAIPTETKQGWLLGRMLVDGPEDFDAAMALVNDIWLAPLSEFTPGRRPPFPAEQSAEAINPLDTLEFFTIMNRTLKDNPRRTDEAALMSQFDAIGVGPNADFDPAKLDEATRKGLKKAIKDAQKIIVAATQRTIQSFNGWMISKDIGRYGHKYMHRASVVKGGYGNLPEESLYPARVFDDKGNLLSGSNCYKLHFKAGQLPPVNGFWSLSIYNLRDATLEPNEIERYSIGDRTKGLNYDDDGSLTILLQRTKPEDESANWMPTPAGHFMAVMRLYEPAQSALNNKYKLPPIEEIK